MEDKTTGDKLFQAELSNISAVMQRNEQLEDLYQQKLKYFTWMLDEYIGNVYVSDMENYELLFLNQSALDVLGKTEKNTLGRKCYEVIQGRTSPCPFCTNDKLTEDKFYQWEFDNPILERKFMIKNRIINWNGRRSRIELSHDMFSTEYKLAKKDRERDALLRCIPGSFARLDARDFSTILWYGADFLNLLEYTAEQFVDELNSQSSYVYKEDIERIIPQLKELTVTGGSMVTEVRIKTRTGKTRIMLKTLAYASGDESWDGIPSFYTIGIDVTKERSQQERQRNALEDACQTSRLASQAKTNFLSSMSHDIRTPMNAIMGLTVLAQANIGSPDVVKEYLNKISVSSRYLLGLINEVLDMSKIEDGKIDLSMEEVFLPNLIEEIISIFRPLFEEKKQQLEIDVEHVCHEKVVADDERLRQILVNLLSNANKYTNEGGVISLRIRELPSYIRGRGQYEFIVKDNGIGMPEEFIPHIFEPFARAEDGKVSKEQGTGLGMTITENIVRMMNGTIEVKSVLGEGSQFIVAVSFALSDEEKIDNTDLFGLSVLIVDDDQIVCESAAEILNELGMRCKWVRSGKDAVCCIMDAHEKREDFFSVILDWKMPEMDGLETVKIIRAKLGKKVPIIIVSSYDYSDIEQEFRNAGVDAFITKPLFKSKMIYTLHQFCQNDSMENALEYKLEDKDTNLAGYHILLVEDNELNMEIAVKILQMYGLIVDEAVDGSRAVDMFKNSAIGEYSCILMDVQMPVMDGYQATEAIRGLERSDAKSIPILALTANAFSSDLGRAHSAGMNDHIAKPIDVECMMGIIRKWIK